MSILVSFLLLQATAGGPATTTQQPTEPATALPTQPAAPADNKKVCKTIKASGSRLGGTRLCLTKEGWRKFEESQQATRYKDTRSPQAATK